MSIKLVAVDLDGTFLHHDKTFNEPLFAQIRALMRNKNMRFVVATGNNPIRVANFFKNFATDYDLIGNNGAQTIIDQQLVDARFLPQSTLSDIAQLVADNEAHHDVYRGLIYTGATASWMPSRHAHVEEKYKDLAPYFPKLQLFDTLPQQDMTDVVQASVHWRSGEDQFMEQARATLQETVHVTTSGYGAVDMIPKGVDKAYGLRILSEQLNIAPDEMAAFGDGFNDLEMLEYVGHSYAMPNGEPALLNRFTSAVADNQNDGVLKTIQTFL